jgi:hypothetical protein
VVTLTFKDLSSIKSKKSAQVPFRPLWHNPRKANMASLPAPLDPLLDLVMQYALGGHEHWLREHMARSATKIRLIRRFDLQRRKTWQIYPEIYYTGVPPLLSVFQRIRAIALEFNNDMWLELVPDRHHTLRIQSEIIVASHLEQHHRRR